MWPFLSPPPYFHSHSICNGLVGWSFLALRLYAAAVGLFPTKINRIEEPHLTARLQTVVYDTKHNWQLPWFWSCTSSSDEREGFHLVQNGTEPNRTDQMRFGNSTKWRSQFRQEWEVRGENFDGEAINWFHLRWVTSMACFLSVLGTPWSFGVWCGLLWCFFVWFEEAFFLLLSSLSACGHRRWRWLVGYLLCSTGNWNVSGMFLGIRR